MVPTHNRMAPKRLPKIYFGTTNHTEKNATKTTQMMDKQLAKNYYRNRLTTEKRE